MSSKTTVQLTSWDSADDPPAIPFHSPRRRRCSIRFRWVRHLQLVLGTLFLSLILGCVICFNPALTVMMDLHSSPSYSPNSSSDALSSWSVPLAHRRFPFTNLQKCLLLAGTFGASLVLIVPIGYSMQKMGAWRTQLAIGLAVSLATGLIPFAASLHFGALLLVRMVNGLAITNLFPVVAAICAAWAPLAEKGVFLAVLTGYVQLSVIISMPLTGYLADKLGWPSVFFVHSLLGLLLSLFWALFYRDDPANHPWISGDELELIRSGKPLVPTPKGIGYHKPPYRHIFSTVSVWAILCAVVGNFLIVQFFNTFLPMFLVSALHFTNSETGLLSALPLLIQFFVKWLTGFVTDHLPSISDIAKVRFCNSAAFFGAALFFLLASLFPPDSFPRWTVVLCLVIAISILGMNSGGFFKSAVLVSAQFSPTVMAAVQFTLTATIFSFSFVVPAMTSHGGVFREYRHVFWLYAGALTLTNVVFIIFGRASPAKWTEEKEKNQEVMRGTARVWTTTAEEERRTA